MRKINLLFIVSLFSFYCANAIAQVSSKFFSQSPGVYTEIVGGTLVAAATATSGIGGLDDVNFPEQTIPFTFNYNGTDYTSYNINTNGYITFGATLPVAGSPYTPISNPAAFDGAISAAGRDIWGLFRTSGSRTSGSDVLTGVTSFAGVAVGQFITGTGIPGTTTFPTTTIVTFDEGAGTITMSANATSTGTGTTITMTSGDIRSETIGAVGSQVHIIQYRDFARFSGANENLNFQIRLYETTNVIEVVYGSNTTLNAGNATPQVGLRGLTNADFNNRTGTDWAASTAGAINTASMTLNTTSLPASGQTYNWDAPPPCAITISNLNPTGILYPGCGENYAPKVNIANNGTENQTNVSVSYVVGSYNETVFGLSLAPGANTDVDFPNTLYYTNSDAGVKNVTVTLNGFCNDNPVAYDLNTSFTVSSVNPHLGGPIDGYFFANSTNGASCAPEQPVYGWFDTTGSTSLILNGVNVSSPNSLVGSVDDGFFALGDALDMVPAYFRYQGVDYDSLFIGTNGMIAFTRKNNTQAQLTTFTPLAIPQVNAPRPAIFPFWKDFDYTDVDVPVNRLSYKATPNMFIITYDRAPNFNSGTDPDDYVSFQVVLEISPVPLENGSIQVNINDAETGLSFLTKYHNSTLAAHTVGQQNLAGNSAIQYRRVVLTNVTNAGPLFYTSPLAVMYNPEITVLPEPTLTFYQRNINLDGVIEMNSDWGELELTSYGFPGMRYLNVSVIAPGLETQWQIQNVLLFNISEIGNIQSQTFAFDIGTKGINAPNVQYGYSITEHMLFSPPPISSNAPVFDTDYKIFTPFLGTTTGPPIPPAVPNVNTTVPKDTSTRSVKDMPNQDCGDNECLPAALSNSLKFLRKEHGSKFDSAYATIDSMKKACGWGQPSTTINNWWTKKDEYLKKNNIPITTRRIPKEKIHQVLEEIKNKQDVEMTIWWRKNDTTAGSHIVNVVAIKKLDSGKYQITGQDDQEQGVAGGTKSEVVQYDSATNKFTSGYLVFNQGIWDFVVECPNKLTTKPVTPPNGAGAVPPKGPYTWNSIIGATSYWLEISTDPNFNNIVLSENNIPSASFEAPLNALQPLTNYYWRVRVNDTAGSGSYDTIFTFTTKAASVMNLTALIQGRYMTPLMVPDTVTVYIREINSPYALVDSAKSVLNSSGEGTFNFYEPIDNVNYYVVIKHRNSIETWTMTGKAFVGGVMNLNFTTSSSQAYGNNMINIGGLWAIYTGDLNQDGSVNLSDVIQTANAANFFTTGYDIADVNGDGAVDLTDLVIVYNNATSFVSVKKP